jgi:general secretion pathway protein H
MKNKGFSLIELMIVLILISLSVALVTPSLSQFLRTVELKGAAKMVSGILRYYRSEAVNKGRVYQVLFDSNLREVRAQSIELTEGEGESEKGEGTVIKKTYFLPHGVQIKEVNVTSPQYPSDFPLIEFYPNGGSNGGSIFLDSQDRKGYRIEVHFLTGMVKVERAEGFGG